MLRLAALTLVTATAFMASTASSASAFLVRNHQSQIGGLTEPRGVSVDPVDQLWIAQAGGGGLVSEYSAFPANAKIGNQDGEEKFGCNGEYIESAVVNGANEHLYVADSCAVVVHDFNAAGFWEAAWEGFGGGHDQVAVDNSGTASEGRVYVSQTSGELVKAFDPAGAELPFTASAPFIEGNQLTGTPTGEGGATVPFGEPWTMAVGPAGDLYVVDRGNNSVDQFEASGEFVRQFTKTPTGAFGAAVAVAIDPTSGNVLIADPGKQVIDEFDSAGAFVGETNGAGSEGALTNPQALAVDSAGNVYVLNGGVVDVFGPTVFVPLSIDSTSATSVSATAATLQTELNPHGLPTAYHFEYGLTDCGTGPCTKTPIPDGSAGSGTAAVTRTAQIGGLAPSTTYHYRVLAENSLGAVTGPDRSFTTQGSGTSLLPDNRGWELVSPSDKHGAPLEAIGIDGSTIQAAADGEGLAYAAKGSIDSTAAGNRSSQYSQLLSHRSPAGWSTADISTSHRDPAGLEFGDPSEYKLFSSDLTLAALEPFGATPLSPQTTETTPYLRQPDGSYTPLVTEANVPAGVHFGGEEQAPEVFYGRPKFITATPDLDHILLQSPKALTDDFEPLYDPSYSALGNLYEWSAGSLRLVSKIPSGSATRCEGIGCLPASEASLQSQLGFRSSQVRHAISADGSRVVFEATNSVTSRLYLRDFSRNETVQLDAGEGCGSCESGPGHFQLASADGSRVFYTDGSRLTADSTADGRPDLYMCQIEVNLEGHLACDLTDLTANTLNSSEPAALQGAVIGAAEDGSVLYFVANGVLTTEPGPHGEVAVSGNCDGEKHFSSQSCNLYRYDVEAATTSLVTVLSGADYPDWKASLGGIPGVNLGQMTASVSPNGRYLAFMSERPLTGYDNRDAVSAQRDEEVFLYDSQAPPAEALRCASCNPSGQRPSGVRETEVFPGPRVDRPRWWAGRWLAASVPGWINVDLPHALYQSRYLSNSGRLFFNAADSLTPQDSNGVFDVYTYEPAAIGGCVQSSSAYSPATGGCVSLISSGTSPEESAFLDASQSGDDVFFLTASRLTAKDVDSAYDVYDARSPHVPGEAVGDTEPAKPVECSGDACQQPAVPPNDPTPGSLTFKGAGNLKQCPKGKKLKGGECVSQKSKKKHHKKKGTKHTSKRAARHNRGGQK